MGGTPETIPIIFAPSLVPRPLHHIMPMVMLMVLNMHHLQPDIMMVSLSVQDIMSAVCMIMREAEAMTGVKQLIKERIFGYGMIKMSFYLFLVILILGATNYNYIVN